ncbi:hypothetical protein ACSYAD_27520 [Acaryochloris marina NIES-2412]|uniref:hypothetical protein n=1 Tax=Acaryochloris marina TaxID=155978 RepID=UPI004059C122
MNFIQISIITFTAAILIPLVGFNKYKYSTSQDLINEEDTVITSVKSNNINNTLQVKKRSDGTFIVNGKPFFPIGIYHRSQQSKDWNTTGFKLLQDLRKISAAGFNMMHPQVGGNYKNDIFFFREAQRLGVYILPSFSYEKRLEIVNQYKYQPAILGWDIADDVDHPANQFTPEIISKWHQKIKAIDPNHLTYVSGNNTNRIVPFMNSADTIGFQSYPIDQDPNDKKPLRKNYYTFLSISGEKNQNFNKSIIANLQAFAWENQTPTPNELRNMTYSALINNVKGIMYYSYFTGDTWSLSEQTELWLGLKSIISEVKVLTPIFLEGNLTRLNTQVDDLYCGYWEYKNSVYIALISTSPNKLIKVDLPIYPMNNGYLRPMFSKYPSGMVFTRGSLTGLIKPGDVHVYKLS